MSNGHTRSDTANLEMFIKHWYRVKLKICLHSPKRKYLGWQTRAQKISKKDDHNSKSISTRSSMWSRFWTVMLSDTSSRPPKSKLKNRNILRHSGKRNKKNDCSNWYDFFIDMFKCQTIIYLKYQRDNPSSIDTYLFVS